MYTIYKITNTVNNKSYIGQTKRKPRTRFNEHMNSKDSLLGKSSAKYGKDSFTLEIIETDISESSIDLKERAYILEHDTLAPSGYNLSKGGQQSKTISESGRESLRIANTGVRNPRSRGEILMIDSKTKKVVKEFESSREAARYLGKKNGYRNILHCLSGSQEKAYGYCWKYKN